MTYDTANAFSFFSMGNCGESRTARYRKIIVRTLPTFCPSMHSQERKTCGYGLMSTGYSATYTFPSKRCGFNRKPKIFLRSSEIFPKSVLSAGLNMSLLNLCSRKCSFSFSEPNFFLIACSITKSISDTVWYLPAAISKPCAHLFSVGQ